MRLLDSLIDPAAKDVIEVLAGLFFLAGFWNQVQKLIDRQKDKPPPGDVRAELLSAMVRKEECAAYRSQQREEAAGIAAQVKEVRELGLRLDREWQDKLDARLDRIQDRQSGEITALHEKVNGIGREVSDMHGQLETTIEQIGRIDTKLDNLAKEKEDKP